MKYVVYFILIAVAYFLVLKFLSKFKFPKITALAVFTGAVKVGKTGVSLACALSLYRRVHLKWRIRKFFQKLFNKPISEEPLFYSNIPLSNVRYFDLTLDHILRKKRFNFGSVVFVDEASLLCDCYLSKSNPELSTTLLRFFKLFGHETHCGYCIFNSQQISDLHISLRKCTSQYFYIHSTSSKWIPFVSFCKMREERYSEDGQTLNTYDADVEDSLKTCIFRKSTFKKYDCCAYSIFTDDLPTDNIEHKLSKSDSLKCDKITSFRKEFADMLVETGLKGKENDEEKV